MNQTVKNRIYRNELGGALLGYGVVLAGSLWLGAQLPPGVLRTAVYVSPMLPFLLGVWAVARHYRRCDEYLRKTTLELVAISAAVTAGWTFTYGFLENAGYPRLSMFTVWPAMGAVWAVLAIVLALRGR